MIKQFKNCLRLLSKGNNPAFYLYDHSGVAMNATGFSYSWDSGQVGWIWVRPWQDELQKEVEWYDLYLRGEVFDAIYGTVEICKCCGQEIEETIDTASDFYYSTKKQFKTDLREFLPQEYHSLLEELLKQNGRNYCF